MPEILSPIPDVPPWALRWLGGQTSCLGSPSWAEAEGGWTMRQLAGSEFSLISYRLAGAVTLTAREFESACYLAYRQLVDDLSGQSARYPVRLWNFIPRILAPLGDLSHRYMVFNAGRFRALQEWLGGRLSSQIATASGVGHFGDDFLLHCLAAEEPGRPVENPRQVPAYRYSQRYGPQPPCFARATEWRRSESADHWLLVGGTASVRGEDSCHQDDLRRQLDETLYNLAAVVRSASGTSCARLSPDDVRAQLRHYVELRVYIVDPRLQQKIAERLDGLLDPSTHVEYVHVDLCRPELLVEIEGLASLPRS